MNIHPGKSLNLKCTVSGIPLPEIKWKLDDMEVTKSSLVSVGSYIDEHGDMTSHINISSISASEGGEYSCLAMNRAGKVIHSARIDVYGKYGRLYFNPFSVSKLYIYIVTCSSISNIVPCLKTQKFYFI